MHSADRPVCGVRSGRHGHGTLVVALGDEVLVEEPNCLFRWRCREADEEAIEVVENLAPPIGDGPVAFVGDDEASMGMDGLSPGIAPTLPGVRVGTP